MISKAAAKFIRVSPRKLRIVGDLIRGKSVEEARQILANVNKKACVYLAELLHSAFSNAVNIDKRHSEDNLFISRLIIDGGPMLKRYRAMSLGRAGMIRHRLSHIVIELDEVHKKESVPSKTEAPLKKAAETETAKAKGRQGQRRNVTKYR